MNTPTNDTKSRTRILFDLAAVLTADELEKFKAAAEKAGASLTDHFLNLTIRNQSKPAA